jgi:hypothetical protein
MLMIVRPPRVAVRPHLSTSPFAPPPVLPAEQFAVEDQVTHDKYGLGRVASVEADASLIIDFGSRRVRIVTPCDKLTKL